MMQQEKKDLLEQAVINQFESDLKDQNYDVLSEMLQILMKSEENQKTLIEYLSETEKERWIEGRVKVRY